MLMRLTALALVCLLASCNTLNEPAVAYGCDVPDTLPQNLAFQDITVVDSETGRLLPGQTVTLRKGRIDRVSSDPPPDNISTVDGCGRYLVPGLADMHVHLDRADFGPYLASGVTTVRNLWGFPELQVMQEEVESGALQGPSIYVVSPGLDGMPIRHPVTQLVEKPLHAKAVVQRQRDAGWTELKLYQDLRSDVFDAIIEAAQDQRMTYGGHVPHDVGLDRALAAGYRHIEHLSGYAPKLNSTGEYRLPGWEDIDEIRIPALVASTVNAGTWNCPTLAIHYGFTLEESPIRTNQNTFVRALFEGGAPLLIGTDAGATPGGGPRFPPGTTLHDELALFVDAGIPPADVLRIATVEAARFLEEEDEFGRIRRGLRADLLLVAENPLDDLSALRQPDVVIARGVRVR